MTLKNLYDNHQGRGSIKWSHYFDHYDRHFARYIGKELTIIEIGIGGGGSLQLWKQYFGPKAKIVGIDYDDKAMFSEPQIETFCGEQKNIDMWNHILEKYGQPDIVIDDGSHDQTDVLATFGMLYPSVKDDGIYVIEDTHTAYWSQWHGGINSPFNMITLLSKHAHDVNLQHIKEPYQPLLPNLKSMSFYDSMVFLEKEIQPKREPYDTSKR